MVRLYSSSELHAIGLRPTDLTTADGEPLVRIRRGQYAQPIADRTEKDVARIHAVAANGRGTPIFSHQSAALLWGLPLVGSPNLVHRTVGVGGGGSNGDVFRHRLDLAEDDITTSPCGLLVTTVARTILDLGCAGRRTFDAVVPADAALHRGLVTADQLAETSARWGRRRGIVRARRALSLTDGRSESPGESLSRIWMYRYGLARPQIQSEVYDEKGLIGRLDFYWEKFGIAGEFDGAVKYGPKLNAAPEDGWYRVRDEKAREDRLRRLGLTVVRWDWEKARSGVPMRDELMRVGVPRAGSATWFADRAA